MLPPDTLLNDRYRLLEPVGEGGMATVYRAIDTRLGRTVAIKILHPEFARDRPFHERFQQEAEFAASLGAHPNIVDIYDIGEDGDLRYIVMEFVEGRSLKALITERAPFKVPEAFAIGQQVASALDFAHKRGLVHRDVKPQNILVTPEGVAKVTDFGIARSTAAAQMTRTGMVMGTVHYFSPEQAQGKPAAPASDIYSLGVILYEMLTGHLPFDAENAIGVAMQHLHNEPPSPWDYNPDLPARAVATVLRALEKDPQRRYRDAAEFAGALAAPPLADLGQTTTFAPVREPSGEATTLSQPVPQRFITPSRAVSEIVPAGPPVRRVASNPWKATWLVLAGLLLAVIVAAAAFFATGRVLGGSSPTPTPTSTPTPTPKPKKHHHHAVPTVHVIVPPPPTATPTPPPPTATPTPPPPTPKPTPRPTRKPKPSPTPTPKPATPTPKPTFVPTLGPTPTTTPVG